jgi:hypothetical protein
MSSSLKLPCVKLASFPGTGRAYCAGGIWKESLLSKHKLLWLLLPLVRKQNSGMLLRELRNAAENAPSSVAVFLK